MQVRAVELTRRDQLEAVERQVAALKGLVADVGAMHEKFSRRMYQAKADI